MHTTRLSLLTLCLLGCTTANAADMPQRKEGLWEMNLESEAKGGVTTPMKQCVDAKTDADLQKHAMQGGGPHPCATHSFSKTATGWTSDSVCKQGNTTATTHSVISGDFSNRYSIDSLTRFEPPMNGKAEAHHKITVHWQGACPAGWKGGDMEVSGHRFNALDMQKMQTGAQPVGKMSPEQMKQMMEAMKKQQGAN